MGAVTQNARALLSRHRMVAGALAIALVAIYISIAVFKETLAGGADEALYRAPGQTTLTDPAAHAGVGSDGRTPLLLSYVDGAEAALVKTLHNNGPTRITITGVETTPSYLTGALVSLKEAQPAAIAGPPPCSLDAVQAGAASLGYCQLNDAATWSGGGFRPIEVGPGNEGVVAVHLLMSHCEDNGPGGGYQIIDSIQVQYSVLGFPRVQAVDVGPYWFRSPDTCPRSGPARP